MRVARVGCTLYANELHSALEGEGWDDVVEPGDSGRDVIDEDVYYLSHGHQVDWEAVTYDTCSWGFVYENADQECQGDLHETPAIEHQEKEHSVSLHEYVHVEHKLGKEQEDHVSDDVVYKIKHQVDNPVVNQQ